VSVTIHWVPWKSGVERDVLCGIFGSGYAIVSFLGAVFGLDLEHPLWQAQGEMPTTGCPELFWYIPRGDHIHGSMGKYLSKTLIQTLHICRPGVSCPQLESDQIAPPPKLTPFYRHDCMRTEQTSIHHSVGM
jgi:hypothetical protein